MDKSDRPSPGRIFVFSAASGAGKTTLLDHLREVFPDLVYSISATTRPPRAGEIDGRHYFFLSKEEFERRRAAGDFPEWACVHEHFYGTPRKFIDATVASGRDIVMDIDVVGKKKFDALYPQAIGVLLLPPSLGVLEERLRKRNTDTEEAIGVRLANAKMETDFARAFGKYEYTVVNDDLETAKAEVVKIVRNAVSIGPAQ